MANMALAIKKKKKEKWYRIGYKKSLSKDPKLTK